MASASNVMRDLHAAGFTCSSWQMGGNCGAIGILTGDPENDPYILVTPWDGPYSYGHEYDDEGNAWRVCMYDREDSWLDSDMVRDGDASVTFDGIVAAVGALLDSTRKG